ncbi:MULTISPECIES: hypothetical protein [Myroides]|uniref:Gliding motility-associated lipoprotein GldH n=1 Tax=Myroides odoratus TaxID=256 RepID=A0A9Q6ZCS2_MYROD|nr:hypothetical protein [Myroides odoratus]EHQ41471.1 hypothetical protein Myrod_0635 [Myroides odoratus DSM 2801]EKB08814.1 hypothetical protein HMPREF9716_00711 [Myroides odoratus CIP 103059]QQT98899.1 hypothetical protein I6I88_11805 [Myroides odoratus]WQD58916.1 hypothetical protein U0010_07170 [Myroides odoratus]STZ28734.1 Uncharacterised protein [Myroides odoratus]
MKKLILVCTVVLGALFTVSCEGPRGPQGPPGGNEIANVFEYHLNFNQNLNANIASQIVKHPTKVYLGDAVFVYVLEKTDKNGDPIWSPLPMRYFVENTTTQKDEELEYIYNFGLDDFEIVARATAPLGMFNGIPGDKNNPGYVTDMIFRVVYVAGKDPIQRNAAVQSKDVAPLSYDELLLKYNLTNSPVKKM